jgi:hypothetical protein
LKDGTGAFLAAKLMSPVGGMVAGAGSSDDMDRLRHGGLPHLFSGVRAPSTLGSFLRSLSHGHVKQLHVVARLATDALLNRHHREEWRPSTRRARRHHSAAMEIESWLGGVIAQTTRANSEESR